MEPVVEQSWIRPGLDANMAMAPHVEDMNSATDMYFQSALDNGRMNNYYSTRGVHPYTSTPAAAGKYIYVSSNFSPLTFHLVLLLLFIFTFMSIYCQKTYINIIFYMKFIFIYI